MAAINESKPLVLLRLPETRRRRAGPRGEAAREFWGNRVDSQKSNEGKILLFRVMQSSHPPPKDLLCVETVQYVAVWQSSMMPC